ncbi:MAG: hydroxyacid dehydrogenase, partial [Flavobacteriales bacterium]|nr:hydroxyacid dehydrogenase [Flavobacteriales bacterium]
MSVLVSVIDSVHPALSERLRAAGHRVLETPQRSGIDKGSEVLIVRSSRVDAELIAQLPALKFIGRIGSGLENIDLPHCTARGIQVINSPEGNRDGVGEMALTLLLVL